MQLDTLGVRLLGNLLAGKGEITAADGVHRAEQDF